MPVVVKSNTPEDEKDEWRTDPALFHLLNMTYHFNLDAATSRANALCQSFFSMENSALDNRWVTMHSPTTRTWCNPPYSIKHKFLQKGFEEYVKRDVKSCFLVPGDAGETGWWLEAVYDLDRPIAPDLYRAKAHVRILKPRVTFFTPNMVPIKGNNRPSALIFYGWDQPHGIFAWNWGLAAIKAGLMTKKGRSWVHSDKLKELIRR
jgi:phage N-6-adenine-methyltransferase